MDGNASAGTVRVESRLEIGSDGCLPLALRGKNRLRASTAKGKRQGRINAGIYMANRDALARFPRGACSFERDIIPEFLDSGINIYPANGAFVDIGTPESYSVAAEILEIAS